MMATQTIWTMITTGLLLVGIWLSRAVWLSLIGAYLIVSDPLQPANAIVPLAGDPLRLVFAVGLLQQGYADELLATDLPDPAAVRPFQHSALWKSRAIALGVAPERVRMVDQTAHSTYEEALVVRDVASKQHWRSLIIVTEPFHSRRSQLIFHDVFQGSGVTIVVRAVENHWYTATTWWQQPEGVSATASEYIKLATQLLFQALPRLAPRFALDAYAPLSPMSDPLTVRAFAMVAPGRAAGASA